MSTIHAEEEGTPPLSQQQEEAAPASPAPLPSWYPKHWKTKQPLYYGNPEALGWALDGIGRAVSFIGSGAFLGTALLRLATEAAGCETEPPPGETKVPDCDNTVYGLRPSSLLTTYTLVVGVISASILPLLGAIIDYTPHRLRIGRITSFLFTILILPQLFISEQTWFAVAVIQVIISVLGWIQTAITYAYLPELTSDELRLNEYTQNFTVTSYAAMIAYLGGVLGFVSIVGWQDDDIATARIGMGTAFVVSGILLIVSWTWLFQSRPALQTLPEGQSLWSAGFIQLFRTVKELIRHYPALKWFYVSIAFSDAGLQALATIAITFLTDTLDFSARENGIAILCMLLGAAPGGYLAKKFTQWTDPVQSSLLALLTIIACTLLVAIFLHGPGQQRETFALAVGWGIGTGWKWTCDRTVASAIVPSNDKNAELMGFFLFSGQSLSWLPPLVFTAMNQADISQQVSVGMMNVYFVMAMLAYLFMGGYAKARAQVNRTSVFHQHAKKNDHGTMGNNEEMSLEMPARSENNDGPTQLVPAKSDEIEA